MSVILPVYNAEKYLEKCLDSILGQAYKDLEVIAVNDGSTDHTGELLDAYHIRDARVRVYHQANSGVAAARNHALRQAQGEWIAFCDSDDTVAEGAYEALMEQSAKADIVVGAYRECRDCGPSQAYHMTSAQKGELLQALMTVPCVWNKMIRASFLKDHDLAFQDIVLGEDVVFLGELAAARPSFSVTDEIVYEHWHHELDTSPSLSHIYDLKHFEAHMECRERLLDICARADLPGGLDYVYRSMSTFLAEFLPCMPEAEERRAAFAQLKAFFSRYNWTDDDPFFENCFGISWTEFQAETVEQYLVRVVHIPPRERVLRQFELGQIGFRYIWRYGKAWSTYKIRRRRGHGGHNGKGPNG